MPDLLLELFSEEIPARMQAKAAADLKRLVTEALVEAGLGRTTDMPGNRKLEELPIASAVVAVRQASREVVAFTRSDPGVALQAIRAGYEHTMAHAGALRAVFGGA